MKIRVRNSMRAALALALAVNGVIAVSSSSIAVADPGDGTIDDVPSTTPSSLGDLDLTDLQYGDPTESLGLIDPPEGSPDGSAGMAHPLIVPPGRAGVQPDLALTYDSNGGSGWVGAGWDLGVGAISVDTEFGAPRYLSTEESETYLLNGERLFPNAIRTNLETRLTAERSDWVLQREDDHDLITRHGNSPSTYCWEVADTDGNHRWYGGVPDATGTCVRDESAILTAPATGATGGVAGDFHWALTYVEDISGNTMRLLYDEVTGVPVGQQGPAVGVSLYLRTIEYTGFKYTDDAPDHPAYRVTFLRDKDETAASPVVIDDDGDTAFPRLDVNVDAGAGSPVVTADLLRGVRVDHLSEAYWAGTAQPQLVKGWSLAYDNGPFDKALLTGVGQYGTGGPGTEHAWHEFTWYDEVTNPTTGAYDGFTAPQQWGNKNSTAIANIAAESALGTSWRAGADGGLYIGFNPAIPSKIASFGGSFNIAGGQSNEVSTLVDLDGDGLPDKVFVGSDGRIMYRPNLNRPGATDQLKYGNSWFGAAQTITGIDGLGRSSDLRIDVHFEAYPVVAIQVGGGFGFSFGDEYFEDVNNDGRIDFIQPGSSGGRTVFYNVLDAGGVPQFIDSSLAAQLAGTLAVPLDPFTSTLADEQLSEVADLILNTSPRIDTVRRWLAPHTGWVRVQGTPALTAGGSYRGDGAQVSVEYGGSTRWSTVLNASTPTGAHDVYVQVAAGQPLWFRLHVIDNAADDQVDWAPTVQYVVGDGGAALVAAVDANGRSQVRYEAAADHTLFGRTGARTALTEAGQITVDVDVTTLSGLSDDLEITVLHGRGTADPVATTVLMVPQLTTGTSSGTIDLTVTAPSTEVGPDGVADTQDDIQEHDWVEVEVASDSPVDPTQFSVDITTSSPGVAPPDLTGVPLDANGDPVVDIPLDIPIVPNVRVFARTDHTVPYVPVVSPDRDRLGNATVTVAVDGPAIDLGNPDIASTAVATVKAAGGGVVARSEFTVSHQGPLLFTRLRGGATFDFTPVRNTTYYVEVSVVDPVVGAGVDLVTSDVVWRWTETETDADGNSSDVGRSQTVSTAGQLHWPDADGMFPSANRGWAYAGYNADHADSNGGAALVETQFRFQQEVSGYDEDTAVPTKSDAPSAASVKSGVSTSFDSALPYIPWAGSGSDIADRWRAAEKQTLNGVAGGMQSDRLGADTAAPGLATAGRTAPQTLSVSGDFNFMIGLVASFTVAAGGGRELKGFEDYNGDGFPDIRSGTNIEYTGPRGGLAATTGAGENPYDTSLAVGGGINGSAISISSSGGSSKNNDGGSAGSNVEPTSTKTSRGMKLGLGFSLESQWTNPLANGEAYTRTTNGDPDAPSVQDDLGSERSGFDTAAGATGTPIDRASIDMNGDGLPDRVTSYTSGELWVNLNLGYRFDTNAIQWSTGRTASNQDLSGSVSAGFELNAYEFAGGVAYSEGVGYSLFDWTDMDGDGVPDRMNNVGEGQPRTVFGSGDGMLRPEIVYGTYPNGNVAVDADKWQGSDDQGNLPGVDLPAGQMQVSRSTGLSGGFDFTFYIGPICLVACYIVINPGAHGGYDRQTSQVQMIDMNGDGWLDAVRSTDPEHVEVRLNKRGRTNMLRSVTNPIGGQIRLDYSRTGNTIANPESVWVMSTVEFDDGRAGDGADVHRSRFTYSGDLYDPLLRDMLGFSKVVEEQLDTGGSVLRTFERDYLNDNSLVSGTMIEERTYDGARALVQRARFEWTFANADPLGGTTGHELNGLHGTAVTSLPAVGRPERVVLFDTALSPRLVTDTLTQYDAQNDQQSVTSRYTYDVIGDVLTVHDENESETAGDDTFTVITYSDCAARSGDRTLGPDDSWVSVPQRVTVHGGNTAAGEILKLRDGGPDLCGNAAPIRIAELVATDGCGSIYGITEMTFDTHGSYSAVAEPANTVPSCGSRPPITIDSDSVTFDGCSTLTPADDADRYCVDYVYDEHRHTDIADVTDNHGVSSSATYDPSTGRLASRTDENGNLTTYTYDPQGRLATITAPKEQGSGAPTLRYGYGGLGATFAPTGAHAWATTSHIDVFNAGNRIDTATFVDGMGRVVQRKRDAQVDGIAGESRVVEGAVEYDALGREPTQWYPLVEKTTARSLTAYNTWTSETGPSTTGVPLTKPTRRTFDVFDRMTSQRLPDESLETIAYDFDVLPGSAALYGAAITMSRVISSDPLQKKTTRWLDVGGAQFRREDGAATATVTGPEPAPLGTLPTGAVIRPARIAPSVGTPGAIATLYDYDRLGRLVAVVDAAGARTEHTYDPLNEVTSTVTPDGGAVQRTFSPSGRLLTLRRANGTTATHRYDRDRLIGIDYSDATPDVTYEWGDDGASQNGAGRMTLVGDGSMTRTYGYDADGNVVRETATMAANPWGTGGGTNPTPQATRWTYDSLGRIATLTYPNDEVLTHDYDLGGRPISLIASMPQSPLYDQYGRVVPRPDTTIVYVEAVRYDEFGEATFLRTGTGVESNFRFEPTRRFLSGISATARATAQYDGTTSAPRPLQDLQYRFDAVGNVLDVVNGLYRDPADTKVAQLGPAPVNNVPGPSQLAYTYDGHYRITGGVGTYVDQKENRQFTYASDYAPNGKLLAKRQVTTTTSTTAQGGGKKGNVNATKGTGTGTTGGTTGEPTCDSNTGSGGGLANQDPEMTYVIRPENVEYATDGLGHRLHQLIRVGTRNYTYDAKGNMTGWSQPCANGNSRISRSFTYDAENRVIRIAEGNNDTDYRYNAEGARTLERGPGGTTWFVNEHFRTVNGGHQYANVYLGEQMIASHRTNQSSVSTPPPPCTDTATLACACSSSGACVVTSAAQCTSATIFDAATSTCQPREDRKIYFFHKDLQGSMRVATDQIGGVFQYVDYLPTGRAWVAGQSTIKDTPYLFAGGWTDTTYKLTNFGERWYDPREQNFLSPEPLLFDDPMSVIDDPSLLSAYTYASSNPMKYVDPDGRAPKAANGYDLGDNYSKHESGNVTISPARRVGRDAPAITFGGRYSNDANGQKIATAMKGFKDRVDRYATLISIDTEGGVRKIYISGKKVSEQPVPGPGNQGNTGTDQPAAPPDPAGSPAAPAATSSAQSDGSVQGTSSDDAGSGDGPAPPPAAGADGTANSSGAGDDSPTTQTVAAAQPLGGSPAADGPDD